MYEVVVGFFFFFHLNQGLETHDCRDSHMRMESLNSTVERAFFSHKELESLAGYLYEILAGNPVTDAPLEVKRWGHSGVCGVVRSSEGTENVEDKKWPKARQRCSLSLACGSSLANSKTPRHITDHLDTPLLLIEADRTHQPPYL